jgi:hypothetical protein
MMSDESMTKPEAQMAVADPVKVGATTPGAFGFRASFVIRHSSFVLFR